MLKTNYANILFTSDQDARDLIELIRQIRAIISDEKDKVISVLDQLVGSVALAMFGMLITISFSDKARQSFIEGDILKAIPSNPQTLEDLSLISAYIIAAFFGVKIVAATIKFLVHSNKLSQLNKILAEMQDSNQSIDERAIISRLSRSLVVKRLSFWNLATLLNWITWPMITIGFTMFGITAKLYF